MREIILSCSVSGFYWRKDGSFYDRSLQVTIVKCFFFSPGKLLLSTLLCQCSREVFIFVRKPIFVFFESFQCVMTPGVSILFLQPAFHTHLGPWTTISISISTAQHFVCYYLKYSKWTTAQTSISKYVCDFCNTACSLLVYHSHTRDRTASLFFSLVMGIYLNHNFDELLQCWCIIRVLLDLLCHCWPLSWRGQTGVIESSWKWLHLDDACKLLRFCVL